MSVRKRTWKTQSGMKEAWFVDYTDQKGRRCGKNFAKKKDADAFAAATYTAVKNNTHVADYATKTVAEAGAMWLKRAQSELEVMTCKQYKTHLNRHIVPYLGGLKLSAITVPVVRQFLDDLARDGRSPAMCRAVRTSLSAILSEAVDRGWLANNSINSMRRNKESKRLGRAKAKLQAGVDIPTVEEINALRAQLDRSGSRYRPLVITAIFTGMRISELRGLRWSDVNLDGGEITVRQRADGQNQIGSPKSEAGRRTIELLPLVVNTLRDWKPHCPKGKLDLVFPTQVGTVESRGNMVAKALWEPQIAIGLTKERAKLALGRRTPKLGEDGKPEMITVAKYEGFHALRHWFASWCLNSVSAKGRGKNPQEVQALLGHATIGLTMDTYGHLFKKTRDEGELQRAQDALEAVGEGNKTATFRLQAVR